VLVKPLSMALWEEVERSRHWRILLQIQGQHTSISKCFSWAIFAAQI
jgi:hypothetical protein